MQDKVAEPPNDKFERKIIMTYANCTLDRKCHI